MKRKNILLILMIFILCTGYNVYAADSCTALFGVELIENIKEAFKFVQIAVPVAFLLLTSLDFAKAVFVDNKEGLNKAKTNFLKRAVAVLVIFFSPYIIILIMNLVNLTLGCLPEFK